MKIKITKSIFQFCSIFFLAIFLSIASADDNKYSQSTYGSIGLIEMPTARFSADGEFLFGISTEDPYSRLFSKVQFFPWMEAVVRYTEGTYKPYNAGSPQTWKDKGIDLKFRITEESEILPQIALGFTDIGGTGAFSSEYIAASKSINNIDLTLGLGWGRLGGVDHLNNIAGWLDSNRNIRGGYSVRGGTINLGRFFSGKNTSVFGGIEYFTSIPNLSLKLEYDSSDYTEVIGKEKQFDQKGDLFKLDSRINYAFNYRLSIGERDKIDISLGYLRGNTIYANLALHSNLNFSGSPKVVLGAEKIRNSSLEPYSELNENWKKFVTDRIIWEMSNIGFVTHKITFNENELIAEISQSRFLKTVMALDLASRVLANNAPKNIKKITVKNIDLGIETVSSTIDRKVLIEQVAKGPLPEEFLEFNKTQVLQPTANSINNEKLYPNFFWEIKPHALGTLQHQQKFYFWQLEALIHTEYSFKKGLYLTTDIGINIANNYDEYTYHIPDGKLYHVRQDRRLYLTEGESGLRRMSLDYFYNFSPNIKGKISAGILEWMYGGIGGEILYMPDHKRWGLGFESYWVKQREFDQKLSFKNYETLTSFISFYRDIPFYNMRLKLTGGKFLGKDVGAHIDVSRRFESGARVGGIVALTDCDSACVGEGSFNKWIYFELPMDLFYINSTTRGKTGYNWSPLTKDAGTKVDTLGLYNIMMSAPDEIDSTRQNNWSIKKIISGFSTEPKTKA